MISCPKNLPFRSEKLRKLAAEVETCCGCGAYRPMAIVLAHPNSISRGKGMGTKADDIPCYLCADCHDLLDGRSGHLTPSEKLELYHRAVTESVSWLLKSDRLKVS